MPQIYEGGVDLMSAFQGGGYHPGTIDFISRQFTTANNNLNDLGKRFQNKAREVFEKVTSSDAMRLARAATRRINSIWNTDEIRSLMNIGDFQHAGINAQRWIMANPTARELYHEQRLDGYHDTYIDVEPGRRGEDHYDYRRVMNGIVSFIIEDNKPEADDANWQSTTYFEDLREGDVELEIDQQTSVLTTWHYLDGYFRTGKEDPTSRLNADMG